MNPAEQLLLHNCILSMIEYSWMVIYNVYMISADVQKTD